MLGPIGPGVGQRLHVLYDSSSVEKSKRFPEETGGQFILPGRGKEKCGYEG